jgi:hypothetical protein
VYEMLFDFVEGSKDGNNKLLRWKHDAVGQSEQSTK